RLRDVRIGDEVQTFDVGSGRLEVRPVTRVFRHQPRTVGQLLSRAGAGPRSVTSNHPIFLEARGDFASAGELTDAHPSRKGLYWDDRELRTLELEAFRQGPAKHQLVVYNLSIADTETYFADGLLVHNKTYPCTDDCGFDESGDSSTGGRASNSGGAFQLDGRSSGGAGGSGGQPKATGGLNGSSGAAGAAGAAGSAGGPVEGDDARR